MKNLSLLALLLLGGSLLATGVHRNVRTKTEALFRPGSKGPVGKVQILIDKSSYELHVYDAKGWYASYPVVFGNNSLADKKMEGDRNTPEGNFRIAAKRVHEKWHRFLAIDYPTKESYAKFLQRKQRGEIPAKARIGGAIGIHGTWPREDFVVDHYKNWTEGCISMKRSHVEEIYRFCGVGTPVTIRK
ncbi:MAG TPA: L,D-transpeptidase [Chitinophagaceae bacterium]|nr:L,D-transpeptidase [Chitinophagaceae bacterium]